MDSTALLLNYDRLTDAERAEADAYLAEHPEGAALVAEGRALHGLLDQAAKAGATLPDVEAMAQFLAMSVGTHTPPAELATLGDRIEAAFEAHPELERQYSMMQDRLRVLADGAESPRAQFERLAGYGIDRLPPARPTAPAGLPEPPPLPRPSPAPSKHRAWRAPAEGEDRPLLQRLSFSRLLLAAAVLGALVYGGLFLASSAQQTHFERIADLEGVPSEYEGLRLRGTDGLMDPAAERYAAALDRLHAARSSTLGLFPEYDDAQLDTTLYLLRQVTELDAPDAPLGLEAWFLMGRILLYKGEVEPARQALRLVVERQGPAAPDALRLLDAIPPERVVSMARDGA